MEFLGVKRQEQKQSKSQENAGYVCLERTQEGITSPKSENVKPTENVRATDAFSETKVTQEYPEEDVDLKAEALPEIKAGTMDVADCRDPNYKTLNFFMDKDIDVFGADKWKPGQPRVGTMQKLSEDEFAVRLQKIKARYGLETEAELQPQPVINWNTLFNDKNYKQQGELIVLTVPNKDVQHVLIGKK
ncbi:unnamed protein product [Thelazia callipaeda]|uniref:XIRP2 n=1 Tax=Thelazia callipaeda TaxID=103827 RepID=A0A0N5D0C5_THECL|nr:unnamed protein product [Thelazia callipaeda]